MNRWHVPPIWESGKCWIIGGGPSMPRQFGVPEDIVQDVMIGRRRPAAYSDYLWPLHNKHVIGVNNAYQIGTWLDALFFGDNSWYLVHRRALAKWPKLKITCSPRFDRKKEEGEGVKYLAKDHSHPRGISENQTMVSWNANSGAAAISLAVHFGVKIIILLGFDMKLEGHISHWHGSHGKNKKPPPFNRHLKGFPDIAADAKRLGIEIINASPESVINVFPKMRVGDLLMIEFVNRLENFGRHGITMSICYGPFAGELMYSVDVLTTEQQSFEKPFMAKNLIQCLDIAEAECKKRGWIK